MPVGKYPSLNAGISEPVGDKHTEASVLNTPLAVPLTMPRKIEPGDLSLAGGHDELPAALVLVPTSAARHRHFGEALNAGFEHRPGLCAVAVNLHRRSYPALVVERSDRDHHCLGHQLGLDRDR